jgi:hypothetical protein
MIVRCENREIALVTQPDHAHFAAEVLRLFRVPELADHPRRQAVLRAVRLHDNGWRETDAAPRIDPASSLPLAFTEIDLSLRVEIWRRGILRYRHEDPYVALLVLRHGRALHPEPSGPLADLFDELEEVSEEWQEDAAVTADEVDADYPWLALGDLLSLAAAHHWTALRSAHGRTVAWRDERLHIDPFPLAGVTRFHLAARTVPRRRYDSDRDFAVTLAMAPWQRLEVRVAPPP